MTVILCCLILYFSALAAEAPAKANSEMKQNAEPMSFSAQGTIGSSMSPSGTALPFQGQNAKGSISLLKEDSGKNFSQMNMTLYSAANQFGLVGLNVGEVVKFQAPTPGWKLTGIQIVGWSVFNNTTKLFPADRNFLIEVRDKDSNLLYKFADAQNMYFASTAGPVIAGIDIPTLPVTDEFYIIFYDRGAMLLGMEQNNGTGNSYFVFNGQLTPAQFKNPKTNETTKVNWLIRAAGN